MDFKTLGLIDPILKALDAQGYTTPSPIQEKAIPPALAGRDVLGCAQTGTGKTCAFAAPILQRLNAVPAKGRPIRALILTPTRELALQIQESFADYGKGLPLRTAVIFGGVGQAPQVNKLKLGVDILVATPGRLLDLQGQGFVELSKVEIFVLDEADRMLDMGFIHDVRRILKVLPDKKQTLFFSATMPAEVTSLVNALLKDPVRVAVDPISSPVEVIEQAVYFVDKSNKSKLLAKIMGNKDVKNALVFTRTKHGANKVVLDLVKMGITAAAIHGNKSQTARQQALADFKEGKLRALVATDIAARGLDIEELSHVFNYNLPEVPETYIHRIGRTGRAGHGGAAISFCDFSEKPYLKDIEKLIGRQIPVVEGHDMPMVMFELPIKDARGRAVNAEDAEARAAGKERRRVRDNENKARAQGRKAAPTAPASRQALEPKREEQAPKHRPKQKKASATLAEALKANAPAVERSSAPSRDFRRPDPLAGSAVMDATARMLAPRPHPAGLTKDAGSSHQGPAKLPSTQKRIDAPNRRTPAAEQKAQFRPAQRPQGNRGRHSPPAVELRTSNQKDSTEQHSLMKPYYLERD